MRVGDVMERDFTAAHPDHSLGDAARLMLDREMLLLPVQENGRLVGLISRRDIAVRAAAEGKTAASTVGELMTRELKYCFEDDDHERVQQNLGEHPVRRLPVLDREGRLVGILSLVKPESRERRLAASLHRLVEQQAVRA